MKHVVQALMRWAVWRQTSGQDMIEYALAAGFVAVSTVAIMPSYATHISQIFSKAGSVLTKANGS